MEPTHEARWASEEGEAIYGTWSHFGAQGSAASLQAQLINNKDKGVK